MIRKEIDARSLSLSPTEQRLLRSYGDKLCAAYFVRRLEGFIHNLNGPLQILWLRSEQVEKEIAEFQDLWANGDTEKSALLAQKLGPRVDSFLKAFGHLDDSLRFITKDAVGRCSGRTEPVLLNDVLTDVFFLMKSDMFFKHQVDTQLLPADEAAWVYGRHDQLCAVFLCIIQNALDAMTEGSGQRLVVEVIAGDDTVTVNVEDSGSGIDEMVSHRLFEPFFSTRTGESAGSMEGERQGIGLPLAAVLVSDHEGTMSFESLPGKTTFSVTFPAYTPPR